MIHVLTGPPGGRKGEEGRIDAPVLSRGLTGGAHRHLPQRGRRLVYFVCGPDAMMDATEDALARLGVPAERVHTERFGMV